MRMRHRVRLGLRIGSRYTSVRLLLARRSLPEVVTTLTKEKNPSSPSAEVKTLRRAVDRLLVLPGRPLRCLPRALVLYSVLVEDGHDARLVVGLPEVSTNVRAHAWVEIAGVDVGPSPGRGDHIPMAIYPHGPSEEIAIPQEGESR